MTCAHRSLPFGTKLRVTHGGRSVIVTVNDRGPFVRGRVLDLSTGAARAIGLTGAGVGRVTAEVVALIARLFSALASPSSNLRQGLVGADTRRHVCASESKACRRTMTAGLVSFAIPE